MHSELGERLARNAAEAIRAVEDWLTRELRDDGSAIDTLAEAHQIPFPHQAAQPAQHLVLAAEIGELTRQEHVVPFFPGDPGLYFFAQCLPLSHYPISLQKPDTYHRQKPDIWQEKQLFFRIITGVWRSTPMVNSPV
jgi:hypothetical protein